MRKIIISIAVLIIVVLIFGPLVAGFRLEKKYHDLISYYNSEDGFHLNILSYQRKWFTSDIIFTASVDKKYLDKFFENATADDFPTLIVKQHIRHILDFGAWHFPEVIIRMQGEPDVYIRHLTFHYDSNQDNQFINANTVIQIHSIQLENQKLGPLDMQTHFNELNVPAIQNLITAYQDFMREGQLYQGQLRDKVSMILRKILANSSIQFEWKIPEKSIKDFIYFVSTQPEYIRDVAEPERNQLLDMRNQMELALHRNELFIDYLADKGYISNVTADTLIDLQKDFIPFEDYAKEVRDLFLSGKIALVVSYQLCWQYADIIRPFQFMEDRVQQYQKIAQKQIQDVFDGLVKKGYVGEKNGNYFSVINWSEKGFTSNGVVIKK